MATSKQPERVALVAGASRGIGAETAKAFADAGYAVALGARDAVALQAVVDEITAGGWHLDADGMLPIPSASGLGLILDADAVGDFVTYVVPAIRSGAYSVTVGIKKRHTMALQY